MCALGYGEKVTRNCGLIEAKADAHLDTWACQDCVPTMLCLTWHWEHMISRTLNLLAYRGKSRLVRDVRARVCVCLHRCAAGARAGRQAQWVPVKSGARWSVSRNDTWQQLAGCGLAVLYIHVTTDKVSTCWAGETPVAAFGTGPPHKGQRGGGWEHFLPPVLNCSF